jgi:phosphopantothenoylcysteine decarboxylase
MRRNILLGVTGSVAAIKTRELINSLAAFGDVRVVLTKGGRYFVEQVEPHFTEMKGYVHTDEDEWPEKYKLGDPVLHIELRRWASCFVIAPLDANTLAKLSHGICDNLLTCVFRAWDWTKPVFLCPAMNTYMWENQPTDEQIESFTDRENRRNKKVHIIHPVEKRLACGDVGAGALAPAAKIIEMMNEKLRWLFPLEKCNGIPINHHPGAFGFHRSKNHHTGVDLYTEDGAVVRAVEDGTVVKIDIFTGPSLGHTWWEETYGIMIEGASGVVNYGEVRQPHIIASPRQPITSSVPLYGGPPKHNWPTIDRPLAVGDTVKRGQKIAFVKRVLFPEKLRPDIPGHSTSMLHLELYKHGSRDFADWHNPEKNPALLDPTPYLMDAQNAPTTTLTWDNTERKTVG